MIIGTSEKKISYTYNLTEFTKGKFFYPENIKEIKHLIKTQKRKFLIKSGGCGHGDKSSLTGDVNIISLKKFNKILRFNKKRNTITAQAGAYLIDITKVLKSSGYYLFNIPGGQSVSLGGAISGNVHGRLSNKKFANFGDNLISFKIIDSSRKVKIVTRRNKLFNLIVGGLGYYGLIVEATLKIQKIKNYFFNENHHYILNLNEFYDFEKKNKKYYGYINYFSENYEFNVRTLLKSSSNKKNSNFYNLNDKKLPSFVSKFVSKITLKILYFYLFRLKRFYFFRKKTIPFEKAIYVSNYINNLPRFFKSGYLEIQFSVQYKYLIKTINQLKELIKIYNVNPVFFILKKLDKSSKKYSFNFPIYNHSISLGFSKEQFKKNKNFFKIFYKTLNNNICNIYVTKDETFTYFIKKNIKENYKFTSKKSLFNNSNFLKKFK